MKKSLVLIASLAVAAFAQADILLWQVGSEDLAKAWTDSGNSVSEARLYYMATPEGDKTMLQSAGVLQLGDGVAVMGTQSYDFSSVQGIPADEAMKAFYIELYSYDSKGQANLEALSALVSYNDLTSFMSSSLMETNVMAWSGGKFHAAPEPTSGLLVLLGLAGLALRRRRARS